MNYWIELMWTKIWVMKIELRNPSVVTQWSTHIFDKYLKLYFSETKACTYEKFYFLFSIHFFMWNHQLFTTTFDTLYVYCKKYSLHYLSWETVNHVLIDFCPLSVYSFVRYQKWEFRGLAFSVRYLITYVDMFYEW